MAELNPHRELARTFAFVSYVFAGLVLVVGVFFTIGAMLADRSELAQAGFTNERLAVLAASMFLMFSVMIVLLGWRVQRLFGQQRRKDKLAAKSAVGCLRLGSLGCGLWAILVAACILITGRLLTTGEPAGWRELFVGASGPILAIFLMVAVAEFISRNFASLNAKERRRAYDAYQHAIQPYLMNLAAPEARTYVQEETIEVLQKLDNSLKSTLLVFLFQSGLLSGDWRLSLRGVDFQRVDLSSINLPRADLHGINLGHAILRGTSLFKVNLQGVKLNHADLTGAILYEADLREADLQKACLREIDFGGALLQGANLSGADLTGAKLTPEQRNQTRLA